MRLWHKDLIPVLPRQQLLGQWRECCLIAKQIQHIGNPGHMLVNPIMLYSDEHFNTYTRHVYEEMHLRGYDADWEKFSKYRKHNKAGDIDCNIGNHELFLGWHDHKYLDQCLLNLQEKHDRGGIDHWEWQEIVSYCDKNWNFTVLNLYDN